MSRIESEPAAQSQFQVIGYAADMLLDAAGTEVVSHAADNPTAMRMMRVTLPIHKPAFTRLAPQTKIPILEISKLLQIDMAEWRYEFNYGMQSESASKKVIVREESLTGLYGLVQTLEGTESLLNTVEADKIIEDLDTLRRSAVLL